MCLGGIANRAHKRQCPRLTATQRGARDGAINVNADALPVGSRLNENVKPNHPQQGVSREYSTDMAICSFAEHG